MHDELAAVFAECKNPSYASPDAVREQLGPILEFAAAAEQQISEYRKRLLAAELAAPDPAETEGDTERFHQTIDALETDVKALLAAGRRVARGMVQVARYGTETERATITREEKKAALLAATTAPALTKP